MDEITTISAARRSRVLTFNVTNPATDPVPAARDTLDYADYSNLKIKNGFAYLMRPSGIEIFTLGDKLLSATNISIPNGKFLAFWIVGNYMYASWEGTDFVKTKSLRVYSIVSDGTLEMVQDLAISFSIDAMGGSGSYCAIGGEDSLHFYKISTTGTLTEIATADEAHWKRQLLPSASYNFYDIIDLNGFFYVLVNGKLLLFDVTDDSYSLIAQSTATGYGSLVIDGSDGSEVIYIVSVQNSPKIDLLTYNTY